MKVTCCVVGYDEKTRVLLHYQIGHDGVIPSFYIEDLQFKKMVDNITHSVYYSQCKDVRGD